jgi:hypothetical protein
MLTPAPQSCRRCVAAIGRPDGRVNPTSAETFYPSLHA